ncbi:hypothetical protein LLG95_11550 [bacterium]|nr:hypothetical protein [bacterium]
MPKVESKPAPRQDCGIPVGCAREVPMWKVALDNFPVAVMFVLGAAIVWPITAVGALVFLGYCGLSIVLFWALICPYCHHYNTRACPCGYGIMAPKFFKPRPGRDFKKVFKKNIAVMYPCWAVPFVAGVYRLWADYSRPLLAIFVAFCVIGFVFIPLIAKLVGCRSCTMKANCPWMS